MKKRSEKSTGNDWFRSSCIVFFIQCICRLQDEREEGTLLREVKEVKNATDFAKAHRTGGGGFDER